MNGLAMPCNPRVTVFDIKEDKAIRYFFAVATDIALCETAVPHA